MKRLLIFIYFLALVLSVESADERESLRQMVAQSRTPGELHEDQLEQRLKSWAGLHTIDGVRALYDFFETATDGDDMFACRFIQQRLEVPREEVAAFLLDRAQQNSLEPATLKEYLFFLVNYDDDPRVPKYFASLLNDKRRLYEKPGEDLIGSIPRVCDSAHGKLVGWLQKKGLIKRGDPGWAWDAVFEPDRDQQIREIMPLLVKAGAMEAASTQQTSKPGDESNQLDPSSNVPKVRQSPAPQPKSATLATADEISSRSWLVCSFVGITAFACALFLFLRKSPK